MYLSRVYVSNFRNLRSLAVDLHRGLNVIVGENNVGKTNLLQAIRLALGPAVTGDYVRLDAADLHRRPDGTRESNIIRIDLEFSGLSEDDQAVFLDALNYNADAPDESTVTIHYEWVWSDQRDRGQPRRWGGDQSNTETQIPDDALTAIQAVFLEAMRDAEKALAPGRQSRLARLLRALATDENKEGIVNLVQNVNMQLDQDDLIQAAQQQIQSVLEESAGPHLAQEAEIRSSEPEFDRIVQALRMVLVHGGGGVDLDENGLGYNNLLFIATVLSELERSGDAAARVLLIEEPEAHLHPQLQVLLADYLQRRGEDVQVIVTSHSPTMASRVRPSSLHVMHEGLDQEMRCVPLRLCGLDEREEGQLRRMLDVTKATILFGKGVVLVEGISEAILIPVLARRYLEPLEGRSVSIAPVLGVDFLTLAKLFGEDMIQVPVAIVTDGDPGVGYPDGADGDWRQASPRTDHDGQLLIGSTAQSLLNQFPHGSAVRAFASSVTLEYDLAAASDTNCAAMCTAWESCFSGTPQTLNAAVLQACQSHDDRTLAIWRGICQASPAAGKPQFAQALAGALEDPEQLPAFDVPTYIKDAITYAARLAEPAAN